MGSAPTHDLAGWVGPAVAVLGRRVRELRAGRRLVLVGVDGRSGSGKTRLARVLAERCAAQTVHLDDLYDGWRGLATGVERLCREVVGPLADGRPALFRRYDWAVGGPGAKIGVPALGVVVVEGVGATAGPCRERYDLRVWLEAPAAVRRDRALERDGELFRPHWQEWARQEEELFADRSPEREAHVVVRTSGLPG
jgi:hypothetical protein